jgi:hypothetical protein
MKLLFLLSLLALFIVSCASTNSNNNTTSKKPSMIKTTIFKMNNTPYIGTTLSGQKIKLGGFSGLQFSNEKDGAIFFHTITDRGPNGDPSGIDRTFLLPEFTPMVVMLKADLKTQDLSVAAEFKLKKKDGAPLTGLPNSRVEENPTDIFGLYYSLDQQGLDIEGLVFDGEGGWWVADEYGPSLAHFNQEGIMQRRLTPNNQLPRMYSEKKANRGFEAIAKVENKVFGFMQSPLLKESPKESEYARIAEVDLETMKTSAEYFYPFEKGNDKIGDAVAINAKTFLVVEQNGKVGENSQKYIYKITVGESDQVVTKELVADLKSTPFNDVEKIEGLAIVDNRRLALVYDNDFQVNGKTNSTTGLTPLNESINQLMLIEFSENIF